MSSFLVNFSNFFNARKDRDAQEAARQQQAAQFFAQMAQQKELAQQAAEARRYEFDTSLAATERDRAENQQRQVLEAQAQGLLRPAGSAEDPLTGNPFLMKTGVTDAASLANPFAGSSSIMEPGGVRLGGQEVVATSPVERARAMLPVKREEAQMQIGLAKEEEKAKMLARLEHFDANSGDIPKGLKQMWRAQIAAGKQVDPISNLGELASFYLLQGDDEMAAKAMELQQKAYAGMSRMPSFNPSNPSTQHTAAGNLSEMIFTDATNGVDLSSPARKDLIDKINANLDRIIASNAYKGEDPRILKMAIGRIRGRLAAFNPITAGKKTMMEVLMEAMREDTPEASGVPQGTPGLFQMPEGTQ